MYLHSKRLVIPPDQEHADGDKAGAGDDEKIQQISNAHRAQNCDKNISKCSGRCRHQID